MPVDHKRIQGPENSVPYTLFTKLNTKSHTEQVDEALNRNNGKRMDDREFNEHRKIYITTDVVSQAKGSAYIEVGNTKVIVACFDPREIPNKSAYDQKGQLQCEFKYATFSCPQRRMFQQDAEEKQNSIVMKQALESAVCLHEFPNFQVEIYAMVLENDGSALSAAISAAGVALAHASVPMYDLVTAATLGIIDGKIIMDPTLKEEQLSSIHGDSKESEHGIIVMSMLNTHEQVSQFYHVGNVKLDTISEGIAMLTNVKNEIVPLVQKVLLNFVKNTIRESEDSEKKDYQD